MAPTNPVSKLLEHLSPVLREGIFAFASIPVDSDFSSLNPIATFREAEGLTVIVEESIALEAQLKVLFRAAWITLEAPSELAAVGLTAAVSAALAKEWIACNIMAGAFHDHLFVPVVEGPRALELLRRLQQRALST